MKQYDTSLGSRTFDLANYALMVVFCLTTLYPFWHLVQLSLSSSTSSLAVLRFWPEEVVLSNYRRVLASPFIASGFANTLFRVALGTTLNLVVILCCAYPLSKKYFPHRTFWTLFIVFTMFFSGGLIPTYLLVRGLGLLNNVWALVLPQLVPTFAMIIARNFLMTIPASLEESARMDGANDITILIRIIVPLSLPVIATITLWQSVWHWNAWFDSLIYIRDPERQVLQIVLRRVVLEGTNDMIELRNTGGMAETTNPDSVKAATIIVTTLPIILFYPFLQKYFVKGVMVGSLKG
jgi:putative aldouronate transport system permease protein